MKRRNLMKAVLAAPAVPALFSQATVQAQGPLPAATPNDAPDWQPSIGDDIGATKTRFFTEPQLNALRQLSAIVLPSINGQPSAIDAGAPEFLDFLVGASPAPRQQLYRNGLDLLNEGAKKKFGKSFGDIETAQAETLLAPLKQPWTYEAPADPLAHFLREAKADIRTATMNSHEYAAVASRGSRRSGGLGLYWYPLD
ncbi:MAG: gluconate 2-dehydrogenase subunit 3 family protein [Acidobacteriota bacterium]